MLKRVVLTLMLMAFGATCLAQASLAVKNRDGQVVGWLLDKREPELVKMFTPTGFIMTMNSGGVIKNSSNTVVDRLLFDNLQCSGQAWVEVPPAWIFTRGEVMQMGGTTSRVFFTMPWGFVQNPAEPLGLVAQREEDGECIPAPPPIEPLVTRVNEINPADYGISEHPGSAIWRVRGPHEFIVQQADGVFCSGFESCPNP